MKHAKATVPHMYAHSERHQWWKVRETFDTFTVPSRRVLTCIEFLCVHAEVTRLCVYEIQPMECSTLFKRLPAFKSGNARWTCIERNKLMVCRVDFSYLRNTGRNEQTPANRGKVGFPAKRKKEKKKCLSGTEANFSAKKNLFAVMLIATWGNGKHSVGLNCNLKIFHRPIT